MVFNEMDDIVNGLSEGVDELFAWLGGLFNLNRSETSEWIAGGVDEVVSHPFTYISSGLASSTAILVNILLTIIYLFLFLFYRTGIKRFLMQQFRRKQREEGEDVVDGIQQVSKKYFGGMLTVMLILGVLNSAGLYLIGLEFPLLWGFLAATLAIIPYIGTILGGALPFLYSFASGDGYWQPAQILILYTIIQSLEGNFITPKVVGSSVNINPLAAIFALFVGEAVWGLAGMVVALPLLAIIRIILDHLDSWKPVALLLSDDFYKDSILYETKYDANRYRLTNIFFGGMESPPKPVNKVGNGDPEVVPQPKPKQRNPAPGSHQ
jgi:predicted PurR-regulated permease PerM